MKIFGVVSLLVLWGGGVLGQEEKPLPCTGPAHAQFDFWLGDWELSWGEKGRGTNRVTKVLDGCVVREAFDGRPAMAMRGVSLSSFNARTGRWQQTWVDNQGGYLDFVGGMEGDKMILARTAQTEEGEVLQRMVWQHITADALQWNWERSRDGGETWEVLWQIAYRRQKP